MAWAKQPVADQGGIMNRHKIILALIAAALVAAATSAAFNVLSPPSPSGLRNGVQAGAAERA
jgi:hypothetical protein